jgi:hypothetical protein
MTTIETIQQVQEVIAQVWSDESLKAKLLNNPKFVFVEYGLEFPHSVEVQVHENTSSLMNFVLPQASEIPQGVDLEEIEPMAGKVIKLALADEAFKTLLLSDPKSAIAQATGMTLPMSLEIQVYEDTPTVKHLVLPVNPASEELSDLELEAVAGGAGKPEPPPGSSMYQVLLYQSTQGGPQASAAKAVLSSVLKPSKPPFEIGY